MAHGPPASIIDTSSGVGDPAKYTHNPKAETLEYRPKESVVFEAVASTTSSYDLVEKVLAIQRYLFVNGIMKGECFKWHIHQLVSQ